MHAMSLINAVSLVGQSAPPEVLQKLTYLVLRHDPIIKRVDTVRAYTFGVLYFVEVRMLIYRDQIYMVQLLANHNFDRSL